MKFMVNTFASVEICKQKKDNSIFFINQNKS